MITGKVELIAKDGFRSLVAAEKIRQGEVVVHLPYSTQPLRDRYSIEDPPGIHRDCSQSPVGAINHNCHPNAAVRNGRVVAWTCIEPGEEITLNYRSTEEHLQNSFVCNCCEKEMEW